MSPVSTGIVLGDSELLRRLAFVTVSETSAEKTAATKPARRAPARKWDNETHAGLVDRGPHPILFAQALIALRCLPVTFRDPTETLAVFTSPLCLGCSLRLFRRC